MLVPVTEEGVCDEGFKIAVAEEAKNEAIEENLIDV